MERLKAWPSILEYSESSLSTHLDTRLMLIEWLALGIGSLLLIMDIAIYGTDTSHSLGNGPVSTRRKLSVINIVPVVFVLGFRFIHYSFRERPIVKNNSYFLPSLQLCFCLPIFVYETAAPITRNVNLGRVMAVPLCLTSASVVGLVRHLTYQSRVVKRSKSKLTSNRLKSGISQWMTMVQNFDDPWLPIRLRNFRDRQARLAEAMPTKNPQAGQMSDILDFQIKPAGSDVGTIDSTSQTKSSRPCTYTLPRYSRKGRSLPMPNFERKERELFPGFIHCQCCVSNSQTMNKRQSDPDRVEKWCKEREDWLGRPPLSNLKQIRQLVDFAPHNLCHKCQMVCSSSLILNQALQPRRTFVPYTWWLGVKLGLKPEIKEEFEHWPTPMDLLQSVHSGCHLCALIWDQMNAEQQQVLLAGDVKVVTEMEDALALIDADSQDCTRNQYYQRRCIQIHVQKTAFSAQSSINLTPHFGGTKVPRNWDTVIRGTQNASFTPVDDNEIVRKISICIPDAGWSFHFLKCMIKKLISASF